MTPPRWYTIDQLAKATGLTARQVRHLLDQGRVRYQQDQWNSIRRPNDQTVTDLEQLGIPVDRAELGKYGKDGNFGKSEREPEETSS